MSEEICQREICRRKSVRGNLSEEIRQTKFVGGNLSEEIRQRKFVGGNLCVCVCDGESEGKDELVLKTKNPNQRFGNKEP